MPLIDASYFFGYSDGSYYYKNTNGSTYYSNGKDIPDTHQPVAKPTRSRYGEFYVGDLSAYESHQGQCHIEYY